MQADWLVEFIFIKSQPEISYRQGK
jgi:hypothetical protein